MYRKINVGTRSLEESKRYYMSFILLQQIHLPGTTNIPSKKGTTFRKGVPYPVQCTFTFTPSHVSCFLAQHDRRKPKAHRQLCYSKSVEQVNATPRKIQCSFFGASLATDPIPEAPAGCARLDNDTMPMKNRSVRTGYLYKGHSYGPFGPYAPDLI